MGQAGSGITKQDRAILELKLQRDKLKLHQRSLQGVLDREKDVALTLLKQQKKEAALLVLKKRKYQEQLVVKCEEQLFTLDQLTRAIEFAVVEKDVLDRLKQGNEALKAINAEMSLEKVELLLSETSEAIAYQKEISSMLSENLTANDEEEIEEELSRLVNAELPKVPSQPLPVVPEGITTETPTAAMEREEPIAMAI